MTTQPKPENASVPEPAKWTQEERIAAILPIIPLMFPDSREEHRLLLAQSVESTSREGRGCYVEAVPIAIELACQRNALLEALKDMLFIYEDQERGYDYFLGKHIPSVLKSAREAIKKATGGPQ